MSNKVADNEVDLTTSTIHWKNNACLHPHGNATWAYMEGFRKLAEIGANYVIDNQCSQDMLVFPILYNYRHYIELACKRIIGMYRWAHDMEDVFVTGHKLSYLWPLTRPVIVEVNRSSDDAAELIRADKIIAHFQVWDDGGTAFRYTDDLRSGANSLPGVSYIGIDTVKIEMETMELVLSATDTMLSEGLSNIGRGWA